LSFHTEVDRQIDGRLIFSQHRIIRLSVLWEQLCHSVINKNNGSVVVAFCRDEYLNSFSINHKLSLILQLKLSHYMPRRSLGGEEM
jgi:hypothetical protein